MTLDAERLALAAFHHAAQHVPAYRTLLDEAKIRPTDVRYMRDFRSVPVLEKRTTFQRFDITQLCVDGHLGRLATVLTSSGHSGVFGFGLTGMDRLPAAAKWTDDMLDPVFKVRSKTTLLINCLPMGVKVATQVCTLAETSVRPDMAVGLVQKFGRHFGQIILVGETAFIKHVLELGRAAGVKWPEHLVHVIVGEEPMAENARKYLLGVLGGDPGTPGQGVVVSSMGIAEVGLNLFFEVPPTLPRLRRLLHEDAGLRHSLLGPIDWVPSLFTYDPRRIFVEFDGAGRLILTTLDPGLKIPLVRYASGDRGRFLEVPAALRSKLEAGGISWESLEALPLVAIQGRGEHALAGNEPVYPEAIKEGLYHDPALAEKTTANFRLSSGTARALLRIQLSPGVSPDESMAPQFAGAIASYVRAPLEVKCEPYGSFGDGMALDYERKFQYLTASKNP